MADNPHIIDDGFSEPEQARKIFVGNLPYEADEEMLKSHFSQFGEIVDCVVPKDPKTKFAKGFGFVTFTRGKAVDDVMSNRPHKVAGRILEPKRAISRNESRDPAAAVSTNKLYVGSIGDLREDEIRNYFTQFGTIDEIQMESAKSQAFITFADHDPVDRCVTQKHTVCGRPVEVRKALTRHQIETATKRRENQARRGTMERERYQREPGPGSHYGGYGDPRGRPDPRYEDRRPAYDSRGGYDRYDPYARERSPPRGYDRYGGGYDRYGGAGYDRYGPPRDYYDRDPYRPPETRYAPPPRDYDRYAPPRGYDSYERGPPREPGPPRGDPYNPTGYDAAQRGAYPPEAPPGPSGHGAPQPPR